MSRGVTIFIADMNNKVNTEKVTQVYYNYDSNSIGDPEVHTDATMDVLFSRAFCSDMYFVKDIFGLALNDGENIKNITKSLPLLIQAFDYILNYQEADKDGCVKDLLNNVYIEDIKEYALSDYDVEDGWARHTFKAFLRTLQMCWTFVAENESGHVCSVYISIWG